MKILWMCANFLHPTNKGGLIRSLGTLRHLAARHEIHYLAYENPEHPEAVELAAGYSHRAYAIRHPIASRRSPRFAAQLAAGLFDPVPIAIRRFTSPALRRFAMELDARERFERVVVDFVTMAGCAPDLSASVLFQHNVETMIWRRRADCARDPFSGAYLRLQADRMFRYERDACLKARHVIAVSELDAALMREMFGVERVSAVPTGVDVEYFARPAEPGAPQSVSGSRAPELVFVGSMDWLPNEEGVAWFIDEVLPLIRRKRPECRLAVVGRTPPPRILDYARRDPGVTVTGTVPDIRPYLWSAKVSIVPLRIAGGTRLKIYESMAAGTAVVSTTIGAEGLEIHPPGDIRIADAAPAFAAECLDLLENAAERERMARQARAMVEARFSWNTVARQFADILESSGAAPDSRAACS